MAISPPGDIVADVMRAAAPERVAAAREKLQSAATGAARLPGTFEIARSSGAAKSDKADEAKPFKQFEAMVLGTFFQEMLPEETSSVYGEGLSGDMWKSILAQHLGDAVSTHGGIGIANRLLADKYRDGDRIASVGAVSGGPARQALDTQNGLSRALLDELQRKTTGAIFGDAASDAAGRQ